MTTTVQQEINNVLIDLDDTAQVYFDNTSLILWINQAQLDIARRAECLMDYAEANCQPNVANYPMPQDAIRVHELTYSPNDPTQIYPLIYRGRQEMNSIWWINQTTPATYPLFYTTWQQPPMIMIQVYPVPASVGVLQYWYYRLPVSVSAVTDIIDIPDGYEDLLRSYVRYCARRKSGDPMWQDDKALYEEGLSTLITNSRNWTDASGQMSMGGAFTPGWLYGGFGN